jgi:two-component system, OmpR family, response regulator
MVRGNPHHDPSAPRLKALQCRQEIKIDTRMHRILLIDDDRRLAELLGQYFLRFDFALESATRPSEGLTMLESGDYELVILDIMLPEMDGFEVCKEIRRKSDIPIVMLTARGEVMDRIVGLELGADDYLPKPFEPRELVVRMQGILKRSRHEPRQERSLQFSGLLIDTDLRQASLEGQAIPLSTMEYQLLELFARSPGKTLSRDDILNRLKGIDADLYTRSVDILVSRLRQKLRPLDPIRTVRGQGYVFTGQPS